MAYTRAWDETFPADTQLANLLGQDIRNTKADVRERVSSFGAGTFANRPTPEAVFAGVMYFATDQDKIFRWNGASWDDITGSWATGKLICSGTVIDVSASAAPSAGQSLIATGAGAATWQANVAPKFSLPFIFMDPEASIGFTTPSTMAWYLFPFNCVIDSVLARMDRPGDGGAWAWELGGLFGATTLFDDNVTNATGWKNFALSGAAVVGAGAELAINNLAIQGGHFPYTISMVISGHLT